MPTLDWIGKKAVLNHHNEVPFRLLKRNNALSVGDPGSGNLLVQGDNLEALKALLPYYAGQVKCIYIDPPYNTGNEKWVYNDNVNSPEMKDWLGKVVGKEGEDLSRSDKWLCMMFPRLSLLKDFLREDGAIFVSIDDDEGHYLKVLMDEVFGRNNFVNTIIWHKKHTRSNDARYLSDNHDFILVYTKNKQLWKRNLLPRTDVLEKGYSNPDNDVRGVWASGPCHAKTPNPKDIYAIQTPSGRTIMPPKGTSWRFSKDNFQKLIADNRIYFGKHGNNIPRYKRFLSEVQDGLVPTTIWFRDEVGDNQEAKQELKKVSEENIELFNTPKPTRLIERIIRLSTTDNDIILDSFAGSGTTGHAVLKMNQKDRGNRKFVLVEIDRNVCSNITYKRLKAAAEEHGGGFCSVDLGATLFDADGKIREEVSFSELARHVYFSETGEPIPTGKNGKTPLLGVYQGRAIYLLYNGILKDKSVGGGNVLTGRILAELPPYDGQKVIYGAACRISAKRLKQENIIFKQTPYEIRIK